MSANMLRIDMRLMLRMLPERHSRKLGDWSHTYGAVGISFDARSKVVTSRWSGPATSPIQPGFTRTRWARRYSPT